MSANIKIGNDTLQGVNAVELENADALGSYVKFGLGVAGGYTVTFVAEGNPYSIISVTAGSAINEPIPPTVTGLVTGWSTDEAGANLVSFPYTPTADITLFAKVSAPKTLEESTWAEIAQVSASKSWNAMGWQVGDSKTITLNGTVGALALNNYQCKVYIIGFDHNAEKEGQGISFGMLEGMDGKQLCLVDQHYNSQTSVPMAFSMNATDTNSGGWKASKMRKTILGSTDVENGDATPAAIANPAANTLMAALPADLRAVLKPITKYTNNVGGVPDPSVIDDSVISSTIDYLPLMSEFEVFNENEYGYRNERIYQSQYRYYSLGDNTVKYKQTDVVTDAWWWLRTPSYDNTYFCHVYAISELDIYNADGAADPTGSYGIAPVFLV